METILIIVLCLSTVIFGALISIGNERQRQAIDSLREQILHWAIQDLKLKREKLSREIKVDDPLAWFGRLISDATGKSLQIRMSGNFNDPSALVFDTDDLQGKFIISPVAPAEIRQMKRRTIGRLSNLADQNPLMSLPRKATHYELSALNCDTFFDLELQEAWRKLAGYELKIANRVWLYEMS